MNISSCSLLSQRALLCRTWNGTQGWERGERLCRVASPWGTKPMLFGRHLLLSISLSLLLSLHLPLSLFLSQTHIFCQAKKDSDYIKLNITIFWELLKSNINKGQMSFCLGQPNSAVQAALAPILCSSCSYALKPMIIIHLGSMWLFSWIRPHDLSSTTWPKPNGGATITPPLLHSQS